MSALNFIFAAHGLIQAALAIQLIFLPYLTNTIFPGQTFDSTHIFLLRLYGAGLASIASISLLCREMPNMLPCKRGAAAGFLTFHMIMTLIIFQSRNDGPLSVKASWALSVFHGLQAFVLYSWYTATGSQVKAFLKQGQRQQSQGHTLNNNRKRN
ncbi:hypothetical protein BDF20DRAFT_483580 [Mycotypha africana]|uniref:uncharacterized protein n=1 Tax=Mycotypha africana TaxID=64632 RepID=UPI0023016E43|nr:uncharacterized protein BDF20DRAFT_483580 [Mycotypha africana]KAI8979161.1 hypothetical protein BDF20DRAFT_483580 [Mycotypha africana]